MESLNPFLIQYMAEKMKAAVLTAPGRLELLDVSMPRAAADQVLVRTTAVGICGTDFHIYGGHVNYNRDAEGNPIPLGARPQILGHEITGVIEEVGRDVKDLKRGDRVILDQGLTCLSQRIQPVCEFCASGDSHQCLNFKEHGITGVPGGFAQYIAISGMNAIRIDGDLPPTAAALAEPLGCILHAVDATERATARYTFAGERPIRNILIFGAGPAGLLFLQYFRNVRHFDGPIFVADLNPAKLKLAAAFGGIPLHSANSELAKELVERTHGEKIHLIVEASGAGAAFRLLPTLLRKQGTLVLYGHGHEGVDMSLLNYLQFIEPTLICPNSASGGFDSDGRPITYRIAMKHLVSGCIKVEPIVTDRCNLDTLPRVFEQEFRRPSFIKAVVLTKS